jgi:carboxylesterase type B
MRIFPQGKQNDVPLIAGWIAHESGPFRGRALPHKDAATFIAAAQEKYGAAAMSAFASLYPAETDAEATASAFRLSGDEVIAFPTWWWVDLQARTGRAPVYAYHFTMSSPYNPAPDHASEVAYVFGNSHRRAGSRPGRTISPSPKSCGIIGPISPRPAIQIVLVCGDGTPIRRKCLPCWN